MGKHQKTPEIYLTPAGFDERVGDLPKTVVVIERKPDGGIFTETTFCLTSDRHNHGLLNVLVAQSGGNKGFDDLTRVSNGPLGEQIKTALLTNDDGFLERIKILPRDAMERGLVLFPPNAADLAEFPTDLPITASSFIPKELLIAAVVVAIPAACALTLYLMNNGLPKNFAP